MACSLFAFDGFPFPSPSRHSSSPFPLWSLIFHAILLWWTLFFGCSPFVFCIPFGICFCHFVATICSPGRNLPRSRPVFEPGLLRNSIGALGVLRRFTSWFTEISPLLVPAYLLPAAFCSLLMQAFLAPPSSLFFSQPFF